jgi:choline dehydrogenase-like flavoprotein
MSEEKDTDYCIVGGGIAGIILATKLTAQGRDVTLLEQGPRFSEEDRLNMLLRSSETLNDYADYNDQVKAGVVTSHTSVKQKGPFAEWGAQRLFGLGGTTLHFEGLMMRPREDDLMVKSLYGYGRD